MLNNNVYHIDNKTNWSMIWNILRFIIGSSQISWKQQNKVYSCLKLHSSRVKSLAKDSFYMLNAKLYYLYQYESVLDLQLIIASTKLPMDMIIQEHNYICLVYCKTINTVKSIHVEWLVWQTIEFTLVFTKLRDCVNFRFVFP